MLYKCNDIFMIRMPSLPSRVFTEFMECDESKIVDFIAQKNLNNYFESSIFISSRNLYEIIGKKLENNGKKQKSRDLSLIKFMTRAATRPTPYGIYAGVALGEFVEKCSNSKLKINDNKMRVECKVDGLLLSLLIHELENDDTIYPKLKLKFNRNCYVSGNRLKNPYYSNHGLSKFGENQVKRIDIKNTELIIFIKKEAHDFTNYMDLLNNIQKKYDGISKEEVCLTINLLIENEILLTNLRPPSNCKNELGHILKVIEPINEVYEIKKTINEIEELIEAISGVRGKSEVNSTLIKEINSRMKILTKNFYEKDFLAINMGIIVDENKLSSEVKIQIEKFIEELSYLGKESSSKLDKFKYEFSQEYGSNIEVPLSEIIDQNKFNGLSYLKEKEFNNDEREYTIRKIVDEKILYCIQTQCEVVKLLKEDFKDIACINKENLPDSFDMNFFITNTDGKYNISVSPIIGSVFGGQMFNRFNNLYEKDIFEKYKSGYNENGRGMDNDTIIVAIKEYSNNGRIKNIKNEAFDYKYYFPVAINEEKKQAKEITLDDLYIGNDSGDFYVKSKSNNKICKMVHDSMINPANLSELSQLLLEISNSNTSEFISRINSIYQNAYIYIPRIMFEGITVQLKSWRFEERLFKLESVEKFNEIFQKLRIQYKVDRFIYLCEADNRLMLDMDKNYSITVLYKHIKIHKILILKELEEDILSNSISVNEDGDNYITEIACSFDLNRIKKLKSKKRGDLNIECQTENREFMLLKSGWVYFKVYKNDNRENEFLEYICANLINLGNPEMFFIRYIDDKGKHLRVRLKYFDENIAINHLPQILEKLSYAIRNRLIGNVQFDTYSRELNRYGGSDIIQYAEDIFYIDSILVIKLLEKFKDKNDNNLEKGYLIGICTMLSAFNNSDLIEILKILENIFENKENKESKELFRSKRQYYIEEVEKLISNDLSGIDISLIEIINQRSLVIKEFALKLSLNSLSNTREDIIASVIHMFCNRLTGDKRKESRYLNIIRESVISIIKRNKHIRKNA